MTSGLAFCYFFKGNLVDDITADVFFQHHSHIFHLIVSKLLEDAEHDTEGMIDTLSNAEAGRELEGSRADRGKNNQSEEISCF